MKWLSEWVKTDYIEPDITMYDDHHHDDNDNYDDNDADNNGVQVRPASPDERQAASDKSFGRLQVSRFVTSSSTSLPLFVTTDKLRDPPPFPQCPF